MRGMFFLSLLIAAGACLGRTITVDDEPGADFDNIQAAIDDADNGDTITVYPGIYTGSGNRNIDFNGKRIVVRSFDPHDPCIVEGTIIDCESDANSPHRGFYFHSEEMPDSIVNGLTIRNGYGPNQSINAGTHSAGGGVLCDDSHPAIMNCVINNCQGEYGGAICCVDSGLAVVGCNFSDNNAVEGGGLYSMQSSLSVYECTFSRHNQQCERGGGICCKNSNLMVTGSSFITNSAASEGGAIYTTESIVVLTLCKFKKNCSEILGGAVYNSDSTVTVRNCEFYNNWVMEGLGGAIADDISDTEIEGSILSQNQAWMAGAIYDGQGNAQIRKCLFTANSALEHGGAIVCDNSDIKIVNCSLVDNYGYWSNAIANFGVDAGPVLMNCIVNDGLPEIFDSGSPATGATYSNIVGGWPGLGNLDVDPCFVQACHWDPNGTPDNTDDDFWVDGDYHLKSQGWRWNSVREVWIWDEVTSRCIDAGNPGSPLDDEPVSVPNDPNNIWAENIRINIGVYSGTKTTSLGPHEWSLLSDLTNNGKVELTDLQEWSSFWLGQKNELPSDLQRDGDADIKDYTYFAHDWLENCTWYTTTFMDYKLAHWSLDDNADNNFVRDSSIYRNNGRAGRNTSLLHVDGKFVGAFYFNGSSDFVRVPDSISLSPHSQITVSGWFWFGNLGESVGLIWKHKYNYILFCATDLVRFWVYDQNGNHSNSNFSESLLDGGWNHIVGVFDGSRSRLYLNGRQVGVIGDSVNGIRDKRGDLYIGMRPDGVGDIHFDGKIDEVLIFGTALSQTEVEQLYELGTVQ